MTPAILFVVDEIDDCPTCSGRSAGPVVWLRADAPHLRGVKAHELELVRQWWIVVVVGALAAGVAALLAVPWWPALLLLGGLAHGVAYKLVRPYRQWAEVRATVAKLTAEGWPTELIRAEAADLAAGYDLKLTITEALGLINKGRLRGN